MKFLFLSLFLLSTTLSFAQIKTPQLIPYRKGNLWGYCNSNKVIKIPIKFEEASCFGYSSNCCFYENYARVLLKGKYYLINKSGKLTNEKSLLDKDNKVDAPSPIDEIELKDIYNKDGSISFQGKIIIPANKYKYIRLTENYNRLFIVTDSNNLAGVIDRNQKIILPLKYTDAFYFSLEEQNEKKKQIIPIYICYQEPNDKKLTIAKFTDTIKVYKKVQYCGKLKNYIAYAEQETNPMYNYISNWGILDRDLEVKIKPKYAIIEEIKKDIFFVDIHIYNKGGVKLENKSGYINIKGVEFFE